MNDEHLEHLIRGLPEPQLPAAWRAEILGAAQREATASSRIPPVWPPFLIRLRNLIAQNPFSFGTLTTLWLLILIFHATTPADPSSDLLVAGGNSVSPVALPLVQEEVRLALLDANGELRPPPPLRP